MPFKSKQQEKWAFATKQPFAKDWAKQTDQKSLPEHVEKPKFEKIRKMVSKHG